MEHGKPTPFAHQAAHPNLNQTGLYCDGLPHHQGVVVMVVVVVVVLDQACRTYLGEEIYVLRKLGHWQIKEVQVLETAAASCLRMQGGRRVSGIQGAKSIELGVIISTAENQDLPFPPNLSLLL